MALGTPQDTPYTEPRPHELSRRPTRHTDAQDAPVAPEPGRQRARAARPRSSRRRPRATSRGSACAARALRADGARDRRRTRRVSRKRAAQRRERGGSARRTRSSTRVSKRGGDGGRRGGGSRVVKGGRTHLWKEHRGGGRSVPAYLNGPTSGCRKGALPAQGKIQTSERAAKAGSIEAQAANNKIPPQLRSRRAAHSPGPPVGSVGV